VNEPRGLAALVDGYLRLPRWLRALAPIAGMSILWWSSSRTPGDEPASVARALAHNAMHIVAYAGLAAAFWLLLSPRPAGRIVPWRSRAAWLLAVAYGVVDELHQSQVPGRDCSFVDVCSDACGAGIAVIALRAIAGGFVIWRLPVLLLSFAGVASVCLATFAG